MELTEKLLAELQKRLKIGNRRGVHLNAIPANSRYKFDLNRLSYIDKTLPNTFINSLLTELPLKYRISWKDNVPDLNSLFEEDQTQLVRITKAFENLINQTEAIESEKGINTFGFGFPILVRRDQLDNKLTVSPILIWSLRIKKTKEFNTWEINRSEDDPIYLNEVLINHLQNDSNLEIEQIPSEMLDDGLIDKNELIEICYNLIKAINTSVLPDIKDVFRKKFENISSIGDKAHYEKLPLNSTNSLIDFSGLFSIFEVQKQNIINDYDNLMELKGLSIELEDLTENSFQPISSVETDPSQQSILHSLELTRNVLIQGPPGTGKSQTLTAILINALENRKKTIVVCEKRTALEVLHNALIEKGLNYHCVLIRDIVKDRKTVVDSVRDRVDNSAYRRYRYLYSKESLDNIIEKSKSLIDSINGKHKKIDKKLLGNKSWTDVVGVLLSELKGTEDTNNLNFDKNHFVFSSEELNTILDLLQKGQSLYNNFKPFENNSFINSEKLFGNNPYLIEQAIKDDFEYYYNKINVINNLEENYKSEYLKIRKLEFRGQLKKSKEIHTSIIEIYRDNEKNEDFFDEIKTNGLIYKSLAFFSKGKKKVLLDQMLVSALFLEFENYLLHCKDLENIEFSNSIKSNLLVLEEIEKLSEKANSDFNIKTEFEYNKLDLLSFNIEEYQAKALESLKENVQELKERISKDNWTTKNVFVPTLATFISVVETIIKGKIEYFNNDKDLFTIEFKWYQFYNGLTEERKTIINELRSKINWRKAFLLYYLHSILVSSANIDLPTNDDELVELEMTLSGIEKEQLKYIREFWFSKQIDTTREFELRNVNLSVENLYNKKSSSRFQRLSLRQIVQYDPELFTNFFPIILTSPDVCCNLFKSMNGYFDIVMFDEASQLRLEDNLPAILKGKQIVVAGDEHQMPPSNYFNKVFDGSIEDEDDINEEDEVFIDKDNILLSCESLLDFASELNFEKKYLDFHYRSRHPYLIDFSNHAFYNQRLKPLPNNFDYIPIKYIQVNGTFSEHTNEAEAEMVLSIIENNIHRLPNGEYPSVGIATFNIAQRNLIKSKIEERKRFIKYDLFNEKIQELELDNPKSTKSFIKNLENIQGDERDVIILSTTYGIGKDGKFAQRFGPINHSKGYKLLNVIITRAKFKIYVCSSIPELVFMNYKEHLVVEGSNNKRSVLYAYLAYCKSVTEKDDDMRISVLTALGENTLKSINIDSLKGELESPFEEEVYQTLMDNFDADKLAPQVKFAGFRIDIVYDPKIAGVPKIAIECDGAKYHSSTEAYLYDRHRQKMLEDHGFIFHRIWSTNWWRNPKRETTKLIDFIKNSESKSIKPTDQSRISLSFTDDIENIEDYVSRTTSFINDEDTVKTIQTIEKINYNEIDLFKDSIKLNTRVKMKYLNNGKEIKIQIVNSQGGNELSNGIQAVNIKSPIVESIIGHTVGDIVKIGNLDNYVEIMNVEN